MKVVALCGSLRAQSTNRTLLRAAEALAPAGTEWVLYEGLGGLPHFNPDQDIEGVAPPAPVAELRALLTAADGIVISSPEYAHGVPGSLKNGLDWLVSCPEMMGKPALLLNASAAGGSHAQAALVEILRTMSLDVLEASLLTPFLKRKLGDVGDLDAGSAEVLRRSLGALAAAARRASPASG